MSDIEKAPLLPNASPTSTEAGATTASALAVLREEATRARAAHIEADKQYATAWRHTRQGRAFTLAHTAVLTVVGTISVLVIGATLVALGYAIVNGGGGGQGEPTFSAPRRIPLEAHIMSKCPDARDCLRDLVLPAMQRVEGQVDFKLSFIGKATDDEGVECMHGPEECLGNILELCAQDLYRDPKVWLGFAMCMSRQYHDIPSEGLVRDCALEHGISFEALNDCASDEHAGRGIDLLRNSVEHSTASNVTKSCTVRVDEENWCIMDGGVWKDCPGGSSVSDLVKEINRLRHETA